MNKNNITWVDDLDIQLENLSQYDSLWGNKKELKEEIFRLLKKEKEIVAWDIFKLLSKRDEYKINHLPRSEMNKKYKEIKTLITKYLKESNEE